MENRLIKKKSFVLCSRPATSEGSDQSNQEPEVFHKARQQPHDQQTSTELLEIILNDLDVAGRVHPYKKLKLDTFQQTKFPSGCNCKKTKCLKLYCQCFASGGYCHPGCTCYECCNNKDTETIRAESISEIVERDPRAFTIRACKENKDQFRGCNCKKSGCQKKYCDCYNMGLECTEMCRCDGCKNCRQAVLVKIQMRKQMSSII